MRHKVIEVRQEVFNHNEHEVSKRWAFEEGVCILFFPQTLIVGNMFRIVIPQHYQTNMNSYVFRLRDRTSMSKP